MNPIIRHKFTCDPTAIVVNGQVFLYTGHDEAPVGTEDYIMNEWLVFSSSDLVAWKEHPVPLRATDFAWASGDAYASKVIQKDNKYYWFVSVSHATKEGKAIGVAVSDSPVGPFRDALGKALITHDMLPKSKDEKANLDPSVIVDDDGAAYMFWGNGMCYFCKLTQDFSGIDGQIEIIDLLNFEEGSHIHKYNDKYYLAYGYEMPEKVAYAMSNSIKGPWKFMGILNDVPFNCETNRPCIIEFKGKHYFIYHNGALPNGGSHRRSVCLDELRYGEDGRMGEVVMSVAGGRVAR